MNNFYLKSFFVILLAAGLSGCFPTVGRMNAKLEQGFDFAVGGAAAYIAPGTGSGSGLREDGGFNLEIDFQGANAATSSDWGLAAQIKAQAYYFYSVVDLYAQAPTSGPHYWGLGLEAGLLPAIYGVYTYEFDNHWYLSVTPRVHYHTNAINGFEVSSGGRGPDKLSKVWVSPQLSLGFAEPKGAIDIGMYMIWTHILGRGADYDLDFDFSEYSRSDDKDNEEDLRKNFIQLGLMARF